MNASDLSSPAANAALDAAGYTRTTPRAEIRAEHWHLIEALDAAQDAALDAGEATPRPLDAVSFIMAAEEGTLTQEQFEASAQAFVDSGIWRSLQGSWQRAVYNWADEGLVTL